MASAPSSMSSASSLAEDIPCFLPEYGRVRGAGERRKSKKLVPQRRVSHLLLDLPRHLPDVGRNRKARHLVGNSGLNIDQAVAELLAPILLKVLREWLVERNGTTTDPLFVSNRGARLSRDAIDRIVRAHVTTASKMCRSLRAKRITPHVLRHSAAMQLLQNGVDRTVIALWLGHESVETTQMYVHADMQIKATAMARTRPVDAKPGRSAPATSCSHSWRRSDYADMPR
jgi:integrase